MENFKIELTEEELLNIMSTITMINYSINKALKLGTIPPLGFEEQKIIDSLPDILNKLENYYYEGGIINE